jgi:hypothetical protein
MSQTRGASNHVIAVRIRLDGETALELPQEDPKRERFDLIFVAPSPSGVQGFVSKARRTNCTAVKTIRQLSLLNTLPSRPL